MDKEWNTFIPLIFFSSLALIMSLLILSMTKIKNNGDNGNPCLKTLLLLKNVVGKLLIKTTKEVKQMQAMIQSVVSTGNPI